MKSSIARNGELCWEWERLCVMRKFYIRPPGQSILARLQPSKTGNPASTDVCNPLILNENFDVKTCHHKI